LQRVSRPLLRDEAYRAIKDAIVAGVLLPGQQLRDQELAEQLGLSRAPVRAALTRLADEGLVESKPQSHTRVTPLILRDVSDALVVVRAMHEVATRAGVPRLTRADLTAMREANARFAEAVAAGDVAAAIIADDALHGVLVTACGNRAVADTIERYQPLIRRLERQRFATASGRRSVRRHKQLIRACAAGDIEAAAQLTTTIWESLEVGHVT
jgi:DNA-binding GntR family transcriptional regulator